MTTCVNALFPTEMRLPGRLNMMPWHSNISTDHSRRRQPLLLSGKDSIQALEHNYQGLTEKEKKSYNEANTVNAFIRSLFEALGWNFSNIDEVEAERQY